MPNGPLAVGDAAQEAVRIQTDYEFQVEIHREYMRSTLAGGFTVIFAITMLIAAYGAFTENWEQLMEYLQLALPAETALLGSAVGFYFGTRAGP